MLGILGCVGYTMLPGAGAPLLSASTGVLAAALTVAGVRRNRPPDPFAWLVFAAGQVTWASGDLVYALNQMAGRSAFPSWADACYLAAYPFFAVALFRLGRGRRPSAGRIIDAAVTFIGLGLVYWVFVVGPIAGDGTQPVALRLVMMGYLTTSVILIAAVGPILTRTRHSGPSGWLLAAGCVATLLGNLVTSLAPASMTWALPWAYAIFVLTYLCWAGAALHPSSAAPHDAPERTGPHRLILPATATMLVPAILFLEAGRDPDHIDTIAVGVGSTLLVILVMARLAGFVSQVQRQSRQLEDLALRDTLTFLPNRRVFEERTAEAVTAGVRPQVAVLDLNGFKDVNDRLGHAVGDQLLSVVARRLAGSFDENGLVARLGGDEFAVLLPDASPEVMAGIAERMTAALRRPIEADGHELLVSASIGSADGTGLTDPVELLRRADLAMYAAKGAGGARHRAYSDDLDRCAGEEAKLGAEIRTALDTGQFQVVYQPIVSLPDGRVVSVEALVRWRHPVRGFVSPAEFIPVAENNGLIVELGEWILRTACAQAVAWRRDLGDAAPERMSVNVSARQLAEPGFAGVVAETLAWTGLGAAQLTVEVTETAVFGGGQTVQAVKDLHELGVKIALDDFGTGHSSLGLLQTVPVDILKVDKSFVDSITMAGRHAVIATALIQVSNGLGLQAVAEGVETAEQAAELHRLGYRLAQGYHFGRPVAEPDFAAARARGALTR